MKFILCQPATKRFQWELEVCVNNLSNLGAEEIILLFAQWDDLIPSYFEDKYPIVKCFTFKDDREDKAYIPSIKPYLWYRFLDAYPEYEKETFFYIDSDVIFREMIDFEPFLKDDIWYGSDCSGYLSYDYILQTEQGPKILLDMTNLIGVPPEKVDGINTDCIGAQLLVKRPTAEMWKKIYHDSNKLYHYFQTVDSNIQKWTAEMWSQLWNFLLFDKQPKVDNEFDFTWATDNKEKWNKNKIYHNAGVTGQEPDLFFKGKYSLISPLQADHSYVNPERASYNYVQEFKTIKW